MSPKPLLISAFVLIVTLLGISCSSTMDANPAVTGGKQAKTVTVAQSGPADVIGSDNVTLQKAADMLRVGDTLMIGPGTYQMENSLFVPSGVTVRGTAGQTILRKNPGVESLLI